MRHRVERSLKKCSFFIACGSSRGKKSGERRSWGRGLLPRATNNVVTGGGNTAAAYKAGVAIVGTNTLYWRVAGVKGCIDSI